MFCVTNDLIWLVKIFSRQENKRTKIIVVAVYLVDSERVVGVRRGGALRRHEPQVAEREVPLRAVLGLVGAAVPAQEHQVGFFKLFDIEANLDKFKILE